MNKAIPLTQSINRPMNQPSQAMGMMTIINIVALLLASGLGVYLYVGSSKVSFGYTKLDQSASAIPSSIPSTLPTTPLTTPPSTISAITLQSVTQHLRTRFIAGDWRLGSISQEQDIVKAYIQIPVKLDFSSTQQKIYIRQSVCPASDDRIWSIVSPKQLEIHLYTQTKTQSISTLCG